MEYILIHLLLKCSGWSALSFLMARFLNGGHPLHTCRGLRPQLLRLYIYNKSVQKLGSVNSHREESSRHLKLGSVNSHREESLTTSLLATPTFAVVNIQ